MNSSVRHARSESAVQNVFKIRRDYNTWVANETLEDYALRFAPRSYRKWPIWQVANTAFSSASFLVLEAIGATLLISDGFINTTLAILAASLVIFLASLPLGQYSARYGLDMDLLTRGSGFGYLGSTLTSLIYAAFTFIFFALEAAIMASALTLAFGIPLALGYLICALVVVPIVTRGITLISRLQAITQPIWLLMLLSPFVVLLIRNPQALHGFMTYGGRSYINHFDMHFFGAAMTVAMAIIAQLGEQADYLRFMPERNGINRWQWKIGVLFGSSGWLVLSTAKMLGGAMLAFLAMHYGISPDRAVNPNQMYLTAYSTFLPERWAIAATFFFVIISQLKINVTNAYAGSLAWSNFFSRLTHSHPGRVVWVIFNTLISLMLMELGLLDVMGRVLGLYSNMAVAWLMTVVADLVINKRLGFSPPGIEFRRAYLYDVNPVGFGAMGISSLLSMSIYLGLLGSAAQPFAIFVAMGLPFILTPLLGWWTKGKYYLARPYQPFAQDAATHVCCICGTRFEKEDMSVCPAYQDNICSLCCTLDARCNDYCKPEASLSRQWMSLTTSFLPGYLRTYLEAGLGHYLLLMVSSSALIGLLIGLFYYQESLTIAANNQLLLTHLRGVFLRIGAVLVMLAGIMAWWMVLASKSRTVAQEETLHQTQLLLKEISSHYHTDQLLQQAKRTADQANQAKSRYIMTISHELRTPLNSMLGYAQILHRDEAIPVNRRHDIGIILRGGNHLLSLIEGTLDIARIEGGRMRLEAKSLHFTDFVQQIVNMFELQASSKGVQFNYHPMGELPEFVRADASRLRQIIINILGNALKFTEQGQVVFRLRYQSEIATFEIIDSGPGIAPEEIERIFEPFVRGSAAHNNSTGGTGLGLTIAKMLTDLMGGELIVTSEKGRGSSFRIRLFLPQIASDQNDRALQRKQYIGYIGVRRRILIVDNEEADRDLLVSMLEPLGFELAEACSGQECLELLPIFCPHLLFMDLAMPVMDGWETLRCIRRMGWKESEIAIISANIFEKGIPNDAGISTENFITKPVNVDDLLNWIGHHLQLEWVTADAPLTPLLSLPAQLKKDIPPKDQLLALREQLESGYLRGILSCLQEMEQPDNQYGDFIEHMRRLAHEFQFALMKTILDNWIADKGDRHA